MRRTPEERRASRELKYKAQIAEHMARAPKIEKEQMLSTFRLRWRDWFLSPDVEAYMRKQILEEGNINLLLGVLGLVFPKPAMVAGGDDNRRIVVFAGTENVNGQPHLCANCGKEDPKQLTGLAGFEYGPVNGNGQEETK